MLKLLPFYLFLIGSLWAGTTESVKVLQVSKSKKSIIIDKGHLRGVKVGSKATFILFSNPDDPLIQFAAFGEAIKVHANYSFWHLGEIKNREVLVKGERLQVLPYETYQAGKRPISVRQEKGVLAEGQTDGTYLRDREEGIPVDKVRYQKDDSPGRDLVETTPPVDEDVEMIEMRDWSRGGKKKMKDVEDELEIRHLKEPKLTDTSPLKDKEETDNFKNMSQGFVTKTQKNRGWLQKIHDESRTRTSYLNTYRKSKARATEGIQTWAINKIKRDGKFWSADMSDEELRRFFTESGIAFEKSRRNFYINNFLKNEVLVSFAVGAVSNLRADDLTNQGQSYSLSLGYEYNLGRTSPSLDLFSLEFDIAAAKNFFDSGTRNAMSDQFDYGATLNFYFYNKPSDMNKYIWFIGGGVKGGGTTLSISSGGKYSFQRHIMPTAQLGMKYRFFVGDVFGDTFGLGLHFLVNYEYMKFTSFEDLSSSLLSEVIEVADFKFTTGLSIYF